MITAAPAAAAARTLAPLAVAASGAQSALLAVSVPLRIVSAPASSFLAAPCAGAAVLACLAVLWLLFRSLPVLVSVESDQSAGHFRKHADWARLRGQ